MMHPSSTRAQKTGRCPKCAWVWPSILESIDTTEGPARLAAIQAIERAVHPCCQARWEREKAKRGCP